MQDRWAHLRGAFVALHLLAVTLAALPAPGGGMTRSAWKDSTVQAEFDAWYEVAASAGFGGSRADFEEELWTLGVGVMATRRTVLAPFGPYYKYLGTDQSWRMFVAPQMFPAKLRIEVKEQGEYRFIYVERDPELDWGSRLLDHDRMRSAIFRFSWKPYLKYYKSWTEWLAPKVAADFPEATHMRTSYARQRSPTPEQARAGEEPPVKVELQVVQPLEEYR